MPADLTDLPTIRRDLAITSVADDAYLADLITRASAAIAHHCRRRSFEREELAQIERLTAPRPCITLTRDLAPVVSAVTVDGAALDASEWELRGSVLTRLQDGVAVPWAPGTVAVAYAAGYDLPAGAPADLRHAAGLTVAAWLAARTRDPLLRSEAVEGVGAASWVASDATAALPAQAVALLGSPYAATVL
jgi:hypothetical protein